MSGHISIHALREEGDARIRAAKRRRMISIHALREEGDVMTFEDLLDIQQFLSTPSARRATFPNRFLLDFFRISIHALREEGDVEGNKPEE